jgi:hypothetical protein
MLTTFDGWQLIISIALTQKQKEKKSEKRFSGQSYSPSLPSSLTHVHRGIGSRNATRQTLPTSAKLTHLSVYDRRDDVF